MKMLMEIDPLPMIGSMVMRMVTISPSRRDVSLAEQLRRSPRLVPPRGSGVSSRELAYDFFLDERLHIAKDGHQRDTRAPMREGVCPGGRARPPPSWTGGGPPDVFLPLSIFYYFQK